jgi:CSLREA domain-containing protein
MRPASRSRSFLVRNERVRSTRRSALQRAVIDSLEVRRLLTAFTYTGSVQTYSVLTTGTYDLSVAGAQGAVYSVNPTIGEGAVMSGDISLTAGTTLQVVVGGEGTFSGGGGGSFVYVSGASQPLIVAGGGGGEGEYGFGSSAQTGTSGGDAAGTNHGTGGTSGSGGSGGQTGSFDGGGGAGWSGNGGGSAESGEGGLGGQDGQSTTPFAGGAGDSNADPTPPNGGYGGGGGGGEGGGGGGGYSGGGGGGDTGGQGGGGGGGSYFDASFTNTATAVTETGNGYVDISLLGSLVVTTTDDTVDATDGKTSLREAINYANTFTGGSPTITFDPTVFATPQTITLANGLLELSNTDTPITIDGSSAGVTVDGNSSQVFQVDSGVNAAIDGLTITDGNSDFGSAINNAGTLSLTDSTLSDNSSAIGGAIYNNLGTLTITNSTFANNMSTYGGGGIYNNQGTLTVLNSTFSGGSATVGGGIYNYGTLTLTNSILANSQGGDDLDGIGTFQGSNDLIGDGSFVGDFANSISGSPVLGALGSYGGQTQTFPLLPGSPAIGAGTPAAITSSISGVSSGPAIITPGSMSNITAGEKLVIDAGLPDQEVVTVTGITTTTFSATFAQAHSPGFTITTSNGDDQRGHQRSLTAPSIGAYEDEGFTISATVGSGQSTSTSSAFAAALGVQVSSNNALLTDLAGGQITFSAPTTGASATFSTNPITLAADGSGSTTATANDQTGEYSVTAGGTGIATPATFDLTNTGSSISGTVFNDLNGNGTQDAGEPGLSGVTIELLNGYYESTGISTTTDANGNYSFTSVGAGYYIVQVDASDSQDVTNGNYDGVNLNAGDVSGVSFGLFNTVSVAGNVFNDQNENGAQDTGEPGLSGWTVTLLDSFGNTVGTTQSASDGSYSFDGIGNGTFTVGEKLQGNYVQSDPAAPGTYTFTTTSGDDVVGDSFGNYIPSTSLSLSSSLNSSFYGQNVTFTATVTQHGNVVSVGTVTFMDGVATVASAVPLDANGQAMFSSTTLSAGTPHLINATYNPDGIYLTSMNHLVQTVKQATPVINVNATSRAYNGQPLVVTGTVTGALGESLGTPTIKYYQAGIPNVLISGAPTVPGSYVVNASYAGSSNYIATAVNIPFTITQALPVIKVTGVTVPYDGHAHAATGTAMGVETPTPVNLNSLLHLSYENLANNTVSTSAPVGAGTYEVLARFDGNTNYQAISTFDTGAQVVITAPAPQFSSLSNFTIVAHTSSKTFTGIISAGSLIPTGNVTVKLNGVQLTVPIGSHGAFSATFNTSNLAVGTYTVQYTYAGSSAFAPASSSSSLNVTYGITPQFKNTTYKQGSTIPIQILLTDAQGRDMNTTNTTVAATGIAKSTTPNTLMNLPAGNPPGGTFTPDDDGDVFTLNLKTTGLATGQYILYFTITGDPTTHSVTFTIGK